MGMRRSAFRDVVGKLEENSLGSLCVGDSIILK
jgi:hypothetical protein